MPHTHAHAHTPPREKRLVFSIALNFVITIVQIIGGFAASSLSLVSDALHNFTDTISLFVSLLALRLSRRKNTEQRTFGYKRADILAALFNASVLLVVSFFLFKEAILRFFSPAAINGVLMMVVAGIGFAANLFAALLLKNDARHGMNIRSAYLHLFSDTLSSLAVIVAGAAIFFYKVYWIDPVLTVLIGAYVLKEGYAIVIDSLHILMQNTPRGMDVRLIQKAIMEIEGIKDIHHLHVWQISEHDISMEAHINLTRDILLSECCMLKSKVEALLLERFHITHTTLQLEYDSCSGTPLIKS
jgi:cobalt-zinc-cadmium efflux system protein